METEATRQLVTRFLEARAANDADAITAVLSEDAAWYPPPSAGMGPFEGRDATVEALTGGAVGRVLDVSTIKRTVRKVIVEGDTAVVLQGLEATTVKGVDYRNEYVWIYTCRDGAITRLDEYVDTLHAGRTFGWIKT